MLRLLNIYDNLFILLLIYFFVEKNIFVKWSKHCASIRYIVEYVIENRKILKIKYFDISELNLSNTILLYSYQFHINIKF